MGKKTIGRDIKMDIGSCSDEPERIRNIRVEESHGRAQEEGAVEKGMSCQRRPLGSEEGMTSQNQQQSRAGN